MFLYVIGGKSGLQKIGISVMPEARLKVIQTGNGTKLFLHLSVPISADVSRTAERIAHRSLSASRVTGEWFDVSPDTAMKAANEAVASAEAGACVEDILLPEIKPSADNPVQWLYPVELRREEDGSLHAYSSAVPEAIAWGGDA